ncbi:hypothetical protein EK904_007732, partial [Melospiza melodia maxima]
RPGRGRAAYPTSHSTLYLQQHLPVLLSQLLHLLNLLSPSGPHCTTNMGRALHQTSCLLSEPRMLRLVHGTASAVPLQGRQDGSPGGSERCKARPCCGTVLVRWLTRYEIISVAIDNSIEYYKVICYVHLLVLFLILRLRFLTQEAITLHRYSAVSVLGDIVVLLQTAYLTAIAMLVEKQPAVQANSRHEKCEFREYLLSWLLMQNQSKIQFSYTSAVQMRINHPDHLNPVHYSSGECSQCKPLTGFIAMEKRAEIMKSKAMAALQGTEKMKYGACPSLPFSTLPPTYLVTTLTAQHQRLAQAEDIKGNWRGRKVRKRYREREAPAACPGQCDCSCPLPYQNGHTLISDTGGEGGPVLYLQPMYYFLNFENNLVLCLFPLPLPSAAVSV